MKVKLEPLLIALFFTLIPSLFYSCEQESEAPGTANVRISMVDAPGDFDSLIISVEEVFINVSGSSSDWQELENFKPGSYDLLKLVNGKEWVLGATAIPEGRLSQVRLLLGDGTRLYTDDTVYVLKVPSADRSGLKINVNEFLEGGISYNLILDFDARKSIIRNGNSGNYTLKPVIRGKLDSKTGAIKGRVMQDSQKRRIYAVRGIDTFNTYTEINGEFLFRTLDPGIYDITIPNESRIDLTISEVSVRAGEVKDLGDLRLF